MPNRKRFVGFVDFHGKTYPFVFDKKDFWLTIFPAPGEELPWFPFTEDQEHDSAENAKNPQWRKSEQLQGHLSDGKQIIFDYSGRYHSVDDTHSLKINWAAILNSSCSANQLTGLTVSGGVVRSFFSPSHAVEQEYLDASNGLDKMRFRQTTRPTVISEAGCCADGTKVSVGAYSSWRVSRHDSLISSNSSFSLDYLSELTLSEVVDSYNAICAFFTFLARRKDIAFDSVVLYVGAGDETKKQAGHLMFPAVTNTDVTDWANEEIISYETLGTKTADLLSMFIANTVDVQHFPADLSKKSEYFKCRIIGIAAAFENEYTRLYDVKRSPKYCEVADEVKREINHIKGNFSGKKKKEYVEEICKLIEKSKEWEPYSQMVTKSTQK